MRSWPAPDAVLTLRIAPPSCHPGFPAFGSTPEPQGEGLSLSRQQLSPYGDAQQLITLELLRGLIDILESLSPNYLLTP